jgi:hypothetical protein
MARALLRELLASSEGRMAAMAGPDFATVLGALARLRAGPDAAWLNRWMAASRARLAAMTGEQLAGALRALTRLAAAPRDVKQCIAFPAWSRCALAALRPKLPALGAGDLARALDALAELDQRPGREWIEAWCSAAQVCFFVFERVVFCVSGFLGGGVLGGAGGLMFVWNFLGLFCAPPQKQTPRKNSPLSKNIPPPSSSKKTAAQAGRARRRRAVARDGVAGGRTRRAAAGVCARLRGRGVCKAALVRRPVRPGFCFWFFGLLF